MGSPKKIASPHSGLLGILRHCVVFKALLSLKKVPRRATGFFGHQGASNFLSFDFTQSTFDRRNLDSILIRALMGQVRHFFARSPLARCAN